MTNAATVSSTSKNRSAAMNSVAAGYIAGVSGTIIGHPIDSMKVLAQTRTTEQRGRSRGGESSSSSSSSCSHTTGRTSTSTSWRGVSPSSACTRRHSSSLSAVVSSSSNNKSRGTRLPLTLQKMSATTHALRSLYAGVSGPLVSVGLIQAVNFGLYDSTRRYLHQRETGSTAGYQTQDRLVHVAMSGAMAGGIMAWCTNPLMHIKVKQQVATTTQPHHRMSYRDAAAHAVNWRGCVRSAVRNLYTGYLPHALSEVTGRTVYFWTYECLKRRLAERRQQEQREGGHQAPALTLADRMVAASSSGIACWCVIYPLDAIRSRMFATSKKCMVQTAHKILAEGGWRAFYRGLGITLLRAGPVHAFVLPIYDLVLAKLSED